MGGRRDASGQAADAAAGDGTSGEAEAQTTQPEIQATFQRTVDHGTARLRRTLPAVLATGVVGGASIRTQVKELAERLLSSCEVKVDWRRLTPSPKFWPAGNK